MGLNPEDFDAAWDANVQAVQDAMAALRDTRKRQADVETVCGNAARARNPQHPVLSADEIARVVGAREAVTDAAAELAQARVAFKAGVT